MNIYIKPPPPAFQTQHITLPWPNKKLSPNARLHWATKARAVAGARTISAIETKAQVDPENAAQIRNCSNAIQLHIDIFPPDRRRRDDDNIIAACKAYRDGIAEALQIDDSRFRASYTLKPFTPEKKGQLVFLLLAYHDKKR